MPMPAWAPVLREVLEVEFAAAEEVWEVEGLLVDDDDDDDDVEDEEVEGVEETETGVLVAVEDWMEKVLLRSEGAGASKDSAMGLLQSTILLVVLQQFHFLVVVL